jgi:hypothetical protein
MKKLLFATAFFIMFAQPVFAQTPTSAPSKNPVATTSAETETLQKVIDLIASQSAKRNDLEKKGILGVVQEATTTKILVEDLLNNERTVDIDELTKFGSGDDTKSFGVSDIKSGNIFSFIGKYNKETKRLLARFVIKVTNIPVQFEGVVLSINSTDGTFLAVDSDGNKKTIDVSSSTKTASYSATDGTVKSGFSRIEIGQRVLITGFDDLQDTEKLIASRVIHFINIMLTNGMKAELEKENIPTENPEKATVN